MVRHMCTNTFFDNSDSSLNASYMPLMSTSMPSSLRYGTSFPIAPSPSVMMTDALYDLDANVLSKISRAILTAAADLDGVSGSTQR